MFLRGSTPFLCNFEKKKNINMHRNLYCDTPILICKSLMYALQSKKTEQQHKKIIGRATCIVL